MLTDELNKIADKKVKVLWWLIYKFVFIHEGSSTNKLQYRRAVFNTVFMIALYWYIAALFVFDGILNYSY